jgi:hypothetical protein
MNAAALLTPGVLVYPAILEDAVMYVIASENTEDAKVDLRDKRTVRPADVGNCRSARRHCIDRHKRTSRPCSLGCRTGA